MVLPYESDLFFSRYTKGNTAANNSVSSAINKLFTNESAALCLRPYFTSDPKVVI